MKKPQEKIHANEEKKKESMTDNRVKDTGSKGIFIFFSVTKNLKQIFCNRNEWIEDSTSI